ncbi:MAG: tetratricopeptide repeat-containing protein [Acaryochloridaceae cyanobacterium RU_4_10]|nr:tetratricopeptide repeat-containing protein [Acaryochloridaceae cyanobacterium RU_4_10]
MSQQQIVEAEASAGDVAFKEGERLHQQQVVESLRKAIIKFEEARQLFHSGKNTAGEATTLNNIGSIYSDLGEKQKALDYYAQALRLKKAVGDALEKQ